MWASGFTAPVPVSRMALTVLTRPLVGWVGMLLADLPGLKHAGEQRTVTRDPSLPTSDSLFKTELHESRDLSLSLPRPALHTHLARGRPSVRRRWLSEHVTRDRCCCLLSGRQELGSKPEGAAACEQADLSFPRGSWAGLILDQGPGGWFRGARRWDSSCLALGWWEEKILPPSPSHKSSSQRRPLWPGPPRFWPHATGTWAIAPLSPDLRLNFRPWAGHTLVLRANYSGSDTGTDRLFNLSGHRVPGDV